MFEAEYIEDLIEKAGDILLEEKCKIRRIEEKNKKDWVTNVDILAGNYITQFIKDTFKDHNVLCEDASHERQNEAKNGYIWIVDPIDGTSNYIRGNPFYTISVACINVTTQKYELSGVYAPELNMKFIAAGDSALYNNKPMRTSSNQELSKALICTGLSKGLDEKSIEFSTFRKMSTVTGGTRRSGCASLDLAFVASGWSDGYYHYDLSAWDVAAGFHLILNSGGKVNPPINKNRFDYRGKVVASNKFIFEELVSHTNF